MIKNDFTNHFTYIFYFNRHILYLKYQVKQPRTKVLYHRLHYQYWRNHNIENIAGKVKYLSNSLPVDFDKIDFRIISLLLMGSDNRTISSKLNIPLSTIQRRTRKILTSQVVEHQFEANFKILGIKKGLLHIYIRNGSLKSYAENVSRVKGVISAAVHVGNSDVVAEFVYEDSEELVDFISEIKANEYVDKVLWSEEVYKICSDRENINQVFKKYWKNNNGH